MAGFPEESGGNFSPAPQKGMTHDGCRLRLLLLTAYEMAPGKLALYLLRSVAESAVVVALLT